MISLKFGMWSAEVGGRAHSKNRLVSSRQHRATEVRKLHFLLPVNILTGVALWLLGPHVTIPCVLITDTDLIPIPLVSASIPIPIPIIIINNYNWYRYTSIQKLNTELLLLT